MMGEPLSGPETVEASPVPHPATRGWLNRNVAGMGLTSFLSDTGHEAATAILPLFLASIGASAAALGTIEGVADAVSSFVKLAAGWYSDRFGRRKPTVIAGYTLTGLSTGLFALATAWPHILVARAIGWLGRGVRGPLRDAIMADSVPPTARGRAFGFERAGDTLGAVVGPLLALALVAFLTRFQAPAAAYRQVFLITAIPGLLAALSFATLVRERQRASNQTLRFWGTVQGLPPRFKLFLIAVGIFGAGDFAHTLLTLRASQLLAPGLGEARAGQVAILLYVLHNVVYATFSYPAGALGDRIGKGRVLTAGYALAALMGVGWIVAFPSVVYLGLLFMLGGAFIAVEDALERAIAADFLPEEVRGTGYGILATVNGVGDFLSSVIVGFLWTEVAPAAGFAYATILSLAGAALMYRLRR